MVERRAAAVTGAAELVVDYEQWLAADGRGSVCYRNAAWAFLGHWPQPADFAAEPLEQQLALGDSQRPFVTFLMLTGRCRPSYDYLASRKIGGLLAQAGRSPLAADVTTFTTAATDLDYSGHVVKRAAVTPQPASSDVRPGRPIAPPPTAAVAPKAIGR